MRWNLPVPFMSIAGLCLAVIAGAGCSGDDPAPAGAAATQPAAPAATGPAQPAVPQNSLAGQPQPAAPRSGDTKYVGGIPYDVFFDRPLEVAADQTSLATNTAPVTAPPPTAAEMPSQPATPMTQTPAASSASTAGAVDWTVVAPIDQISEEITSLRNVLSQELNTLATYNGSWESIGVDAIVMAALAGIVERHPGEVSWKPNAHLARELATEIDSGATKTGRSAYTATKDPFDALVDLFNGNAPPGKEAEEGIPFGDFADRSVLMARMEASKNNLRSNITTEERLTEDPAAIKRELMVLAALATVVSTEGYDYVEEPQYQGFVNTFVQAALDARSAVDAKNLEGFRAGIDIIEKTCNECHQKYAFGSDGF